MHSVASFACRLSIVDRGYRFKISCMISVNLGSNPSETFLASSMKKFPFFEGSHRTVVSTVSFVPPKTTQNPKKTITYTILKTFSRTLKKIHTKYRSFFFCLCERPQELLTQDVVSQGQDVTFFTTSIHVLTLNKVLCTLHSYFQRPRRGREVCDDVSCFLLSE